MTELMPKTVKTQAEINFVSTPNCMFKICECPDQCIKKSVKKKTLYVVLIVK